MKTKEEKLLLLLIPEALALSIINTKKKKMKL